MSTLRQLTFLRVIVEPQSYLNIFYLLLAFPLGIAYFVFLVTGISVGAGLIIIWVGVPILALVFVGSWAMCEFERILAVYIFKEDIPPTTRGRSAVTVDQHLSSVERLFVGAWRRFKSHLTNRLTWTGILYLLIKFPLGIATFTIVVTLVSLSVALTTAPAFMWTSDTVTWGSWTFDPFHYSWILPVFGVPALFISLHLMNLTAFLSGRFARVMLGPIGQANVAGDSDSPPAGKSVQSPEQYRKAVQINWRVVGLRTFYSHLAIFAAIITMLLFIDLAAGAGWWFYWPLMGWGIGVAVHGIVTFAIFGAGRPR